MSSLRQASHLNHNNSLTFNFSHRCNVRITTPKEVAFVQAEISRREEELSTLEARLLADRQKLEAHELAVRALVIKIDYAEGRLVAQERYLADLVSLNQRLDTAELNLEEVNPLPDQILHHKQEVAILRPKIQEMIQELHARRLVYNVSRTYLDTLESHKGCLLDMLGGLRAAFSPSHVIPAEVLAAIFRLRMEDDVRCYLKASGGFLYWCSPLVLAQVCSFWREVVHTEKNIWRYFICRLRWMSDPLHMEAWKRFASFHSAAPTLLASLDDSTTPATTATHAILNPSPNSVHVFSKGPAQPIPGNISFSQVKSLTLEMNCSPSVDFIDKIHIFFPVATKIDINCSEHFSIIHTDLHTRRNPEITSLRMDLTTFDSFGIDYYGSTTYLEELHVIHSGVNRLVRYAGIEYRKLSVLGVTPPDNVWIEAAQLPLLLKLVLYGPKVRTLAPPQLIGLSQHPNFLQVKELVFQGWPIYEPLVLPTWSIMPLVSSIADRLRLVETIQCVDSYIEGESFVALIKQLANTNANQTPSKLKKVVVDCCSGITRRHCELIAAEVEKLVVHI